MAHLCKQRQLMKTSGCHLSSPSTQSLTQNTHIFHFMLKVNAGQDKLTNFHQTVSTGQIRLTHPQRSTALVLTFTEEQVQISCVTPPVRATIILGFWKHLHQYQQNKCTLLGLQNLGHQKLYQYYNIAIQSLGTAQNL